MWQALSEHLVHIGIAGVLDIVVASTVIIWILMTKRDSTAATAWCLVVLMVPLFGAVLFWVFGYNRVHRPLQRKRAHHSRFRAAHPARNPEAIPGEKGAAEGTPTWGNLGHLALHVNAFPVSAGNEVALYPETNTAFARLLAAIRAARHHVHLEFFIFRSDETGKQLADALIEKARQGVEVRLLVDGVGTGTLRRRLRKPLEEAGVKIATFIPVSLLRLRIRVNLRNHRKIVVVDGEVAFTGGMNIGDEYLGKDPTFGYWRDTFLELRGPAAAALQRVFTEDWDFAAHEALTGANYFPVVPGKGSHLVQVIASGPDEELNGIREIYFAAILAAKTRVWIASPYFVPDAGLLDALRLASMRGVEVRLLSLLRPDHYLSFYAGRYYWADLLAAGADVYQYRKGMMHSKMLLIDDDWAMVGSANLDNRSLHLNFEVACLIYARELIAEVEKSFCRDWQDAILLDARTYRQRSFATRLAENACRLFAPTL